MQQPQYVHEIQLLDEQTLGLVNQIVSNAPYIDGKTTATDAAKLVKNNLQIDLNDRTV